MIDDIEFAKRFPYECRTTHAYAEVVPWCEENFGPFNGRWMRYGRDIMAGFAGQPLWEYYRFGDEQAAILFGLRWS